MEALKIKKRDGRFEPFNPNKILSRIKTQAKGLSVNADYLFLDVTKLIGDNMSSIDLDELIIRTAASKKIDHPDYGTLAAKILATRLHKECTSTLLEIAEISSQGFKASALDINYLEKVKKYGSQLDEILQHERDFNFDIFGLSTLVDRYLLKFNKKIIESPQQMYMRVALIVADDNIESVTKTYNLLSSGYYSHATPTMMNAGRIKQQLASCFLLETGDDIDELMGDLTDMAKLSKYAGGLGVSITPVRASGSDVAGLGQSQGILPLCKEYEQTMRWINQLGMRKGACAVYLEPWHKDFYTFLDLRKNSGKDDIRARDLFLGVWASNYFFECVENDTPWYLFCPNEILEKTGIKLQDLVGDEFKEKYLELIENKDVPKIKVEAQDVWCKIIDSLIETGMPYILNKDESNIKSNQKNAGIIHNSNLCAEILEVTNRGEIATCNLSSICLPKFVENEKFNYSKLLEITKFAVHNTDNVIDVNYYPVDRTKFSNNKMRPIGIGVQGLADVFAMMKIPFDSEQAAKINKNIFEVIYYASLEASMEKAKVEGTYSKYEGSPISKGIYQFHEWGVTPTGIDGILNWEQLMKEISKYGIRNSLLVALMPTASTSLILDNNECFEPFTSNVYARKTLSGTFQVINKHLVKELIKINLWNKDTWKIIVANKGSVNILNKELIGEDKEIVEKFLEQIPNNLKEIYKTVWEISMRSIIDMAADRSAYIDQTQSMNLFIAEPNISKVSSMLMYAAKRKLKTLVYYLRTRTKIEADKKLAFRLSDINVVEVVKPENSLFECVGCSA